MKILVIDVGGTHAKVLATGHQKRVEIPSGPKMTPAKMVAAVRTVWKNWFIKWHKGPAGGARRWSRQVRIDGGAQPPDEFDGVKDGLMEGVPGAGPQASGFLGGRLLLGQPLACRVQSGSLITASWLANCCSIRRIKLCVRHKNSACAALAVGEVAQDFFSLSLFFKPSNTFSIRQRRW